RSSSRRTSTRWRRSATTLVAAPPRRKLSTRRSSRTESSVPSLDSFIDELLKIAEAEKVEKAMEKAVPTVPALKRRLRAGDVLFTAPRRSKMKSTFGRFIFKPVSRAVQK